MENHFNCIYCYTNKINGKKYIGQTKNFKRRHEQHLCGKEQLIDRKIKEYGIKNFKIEILEENLDDDDMDVKEIYYIDFYDTLVQNNKGYNVCKGGKGCNIPLLNKSVLQLDSTTKKFIKRFNSISEASEKLNLQQASISDCCRRKQHSADEYTFMYDNIEEILNVYFESDLFKLAYLIENFDLKDILSQLGLEKIKKMILNSNYDTEYFNNLPVWLLNGGTEYYYTYHELITHSEDLISSIKDIVISKYFYGTKDIYYEYKIF